MTSSVRFSPSQIAAAKAAAPAPTSSDDKIDWSHAMVSPGGGVEATVSALRKMRGPNKKPAKEQVAIRLDQDLVSALRASGPGWQTRVNTVLKDWLACQASRGAAKPHG